MVIVNNKQQMTTFKKLEKRQKQNLFCPCYFYVYIFETFAKRPLLPPSIGGMPDSSLKPAFLMFPAIQNLTYGCHIW
jgi:hypothetical protein